MDVIRWINYYIIVDVGFSRERGSTAKRATQEFLHHSQNRLATHLPRLLGAVAGCT